MYRNLERQLKTIERRLLALDRKVIPQGVEGAARARYFQQAKPVLQSIVRAAQALPALIDAVAANPDDGADGNFDNAWNRCLDAFARLDDYAKELRNFYMYAPGGLSGRR